MSDASERKTGRTAEMIRQLPASGNCTVIVHSPTMAGYVRRLTQHLRGRGVSNMVTIVSVQNRQDAARALIGKSTPVFIDHAFHESGVPSPELCAYVQQLADDANALHAAA